MPTRPVLEVVRNRTFLTLSPASSLREAAKKMKEAHQGAALVMSHGQIQGICTERDLVFRAMAEGLNPDTTDVSTIMTPHPETIRPEKPFCHALHIMFEGGFRHLPVVDASGHPQGILSARDALGIEALQFSYELEQREKVTAIL